MHGRYFRSLLMYPGSGAFKSLCLDLSSLPLPSRIRPAPCRRRQGSRPERDIVGFRNSRTTAIRSTSDSRHVLRSASPPQPVRCGQGGLKSVGVVRCVAAILNTVSHALFLVSLFSGCVGFRQDQRRFNTRLNGRRYLWCWCWCRLAMTSDKHWCRPSEYPPSTDLARKEQNDEGLCKHPG